MRLRNLPRRCLAWLGIVSGSTATRAACNLLANHGGCHQDSQLRVRWTPIYKQIISMGENMKPIGYQWSEYVTCPHCGFEDGCSWEYSAMEEDPKEVQCGGCDKTFMCKRHVMVRYSSSFMNIEEQK